MNYLLNGMEDVQLKQEPTTIRIIKFLAMQSGRYGDQYTRPYEMGNVTHDVIETIGSRMDAGVQITPDQLSGLTDKLISPSVRAEAKVFIPSGMGDFRFFFNMTVEIRQGMRVNYEMVSGYTDHFGYANNTVDPNMKFYIDGIVNANSSKRNVGGQMVEIMQPSMISQLLPDQRFSEYSQNQSMNFRMRPMEVVRGIHHASMPEVNGVYPMDMTAVNNIAAKSMRSYNSPSHYAATILDGYRQAMGASTTDEDGFGFVNTTQADIITSTIKAFKTPSSVEDAFLGALSSVTGLPAPQSFTLRDLERIDSNIHHVIHFHTLDNNGLRKVTNPSQGQHWQSEDRETQIAALLSQAVPNIMMTLGIGSVAFNANNLIPAMGHAVRLENIDCLNQFINMAAVRQRFIDEMSRTVLQDVSFNNQIEYNITMSIDLNTESRIYISLAGQEVIEYYMPCWCSALMSPVTTLNNKRLENISRSFGKLFEAVGMSPQQQHIEFMAESDPMVLNDITHGIGGAPFGGQSLFSNHPGQQPAQPGQYNSLLADARSLNI